ncbi:unnamed protein product [Rotaria magnacalcarata]|uniref:Uncharacterized protein n=1 Tax=Rotaria magnacalcarata TaxID=392030 RepID=A0A815M2L6_9BILA|nr:unnamed protein product [Rotaria magnacalcarata]CAF4332338.1 unnamed protein product [Rotaria magnacalcarata]
MTVFSSIEKSSTIHELCPDIWAQIFEYFEIMDLFTTFVSITDAVDQVVFNENNRFLLRGLILDAGVKDVPESIPFNRVISLTLNETTTLGVLQDCCELRSLKLIGKNEWIRWIIRNIRQRNTKLNQLTVATPKIESISELLMPILSISSLHRLEIHTDEIVETTKVSTLATITSYIEQFIFDSDSTINWNEFSLTLPEFTRIRLPSISLINRNQKSVPSFIFQNLRTLSLGLLEVSFNWIIQLLTTTPCLVKLKLTGLVDADGFVVSQKWICLFEPAQTLVRTFVNVSLEQDDESYHCENIQAPLCALNLSLICNGDDNDCNVYYGTVNRWWSLRVRSLIELVKNENFYHNRFAHIVGLVNEAIKNIARNFSFSELYEIAALNNVLKCNIQSVYPTIDYRSDLNIMNNTFEHAQCSIASKTICLFWTHTESEIETRRSNAGNWSPNHFVPLLLPSDNSLSQNHLAQPNISGSGLTPTKATTKNNTLTQVRIPEFNADHDEIQPFQVPSTVITTTNEITTPRIKCRLQLEETCATVESTIVEHKRMQARERMAAKRAAPTPEEAERQRMLARERSATRRAALTPQQVEREHTLARERSATRRAVLTPEEIEQQRRTIREINATRRAALTPKEAAQQPTFAAARSMTKRATASPVEAEEQRVLARNRSAARRAAYTPEEAKKQQELALKRIRLQKNDKNK